MRVDRWPVLYVAFMGACAVSWLVPLVAKWL